MPGFFFGGTFRSAKASAIFWHSAKAASSASAPP
jgi:hypothetical protein